MKRKRQATKAIRIKVDDKLTRIEPSDTNVKVHVESNAKGGLDLVMEIEVD